MGCGGAHRGTDVQSQRRRRTVTEAQRADRQLYRWTGARTQAGRAAITETGKESERGSGEGVEKGGGAGAGGRGGGGREEILRLCGIRVMRYNSLCRMRCNSLCRMPCNSLCRTSQYAVHLTMPYISLCRTTDTRAWQRADHGRCAQNHSPHHAVQPAWSSDGVGRVAG